MRKQRKINGLGKNQEEEKEEKDGKTQRISARGEGEE